MHSIICYHLVPASHDHRNNLKRAVLGRRIIDLTNEPITQPFYEMKRERAGRRTSANVKPLRKP